MWNEMLKPEMWSGMLDHMLTPEISILEKMFRPVIVYMFLLISLRLAGKRELAQLNAMDLIVLLTLSNTVQNAIIGSDNSVSGGLIGAATLLGLNYFVVRFLFSHERIDRVVEGEPVMLIEGGRVMPDRMKNEFITDAELQAAAHKQGFSSLDAVDPEPLPAGHWLYTHPRVHLSPHISWSMPGATDVLVATFLENLRRYVAGEPLDGVVDVDAGY